MLGWPLADIWWNLLIHGFCSLFFTLLLWNCWDLSSADSIGMTFICFSCLSWLILPVIIVIRCFNMLQSQILFKWIGRTIIWGLWIPIWIRQVIWELCIHIWIRQVIWELCIHIWIWQVSCVLATFIAWHGASRLELVLSKKFGEVL